MASLYEVKEGLFYFAKYKNSELEIVGSISLLKLLILG
jgi:hypothetical protein